MAAEKKEAGKGFKHAIIAIAIIIVAGLITWGIVALVRNRKNKAALDAASKAAEANPNVPANYDTLANSAHAASAPHLYIHSIPSNVTNFPLMKGSKGTEVKKLQNALNTLYNSKLAEDGDFGDLTLAAYVTNIGAHSDKYPVSQKTYSDIIANANTAQPS